MRIEDCSISHIMDNPLVFCARSPFSSTADARQLTSLRDRLGDSFQAGLVIHPSTTAFRLDDRIAAAPLGTLV